MSLYWLVWLVLGFGVPEGIALVSKHYENTLSETVWRWCDVVPGSTLLQWTALHVMLGMCLIWLFVHLTFGLWR